MKTLGIDIGTHSITGCIIDCESGKIVSEIYKVPVETSLTPPTAISKFHGLLRHFKWNKGNIGISIPEVIRNGTVCSSNVMDMLWLEVNAEQLFMEIADSPIHIIKTMDAIGTAETYFGAASTQYGTVIFLEVYKNLRSSVFFDKKLMPNIELGYLVLGSKTAKGLLKTKMVDGEPVKKKKPFKRTEFVLQHLEEIFHPDLFVIGNEMSTKLGKYSRLLDIRTAYTDSKIKNYPANIGAATAAWLRFR